MDATKEYRFKIRHGKVHILKYLGRDKRVVIPGYIDGMPVTKIATWAFVNNKDISEVVIPDTVRFIGYGAFGICPNLKKAVFTGRVYLDGAVFVSSGLEQIDGLEYITGNDSGRCFFDGTPFLEKNDILIVDNMLIRCRTQDEVYKVPSNVASIGYWAFNGSPVREVILPDGLKHIHVYAFDHTNISAFRIPDSVEVLETGALTTHSHSDSLDEWYLPQDFGRRPGWETNDFFASRCVIHDTQFRTDKQSYKATGELVYEDVSCISCSSYDLFSEPLYKQVFPKRLEYLKHVRSLANARINVFRTDDFKIEKCEEVFSSVSGYTLPSHNMPRRFRLIFDLEDSYGEILFYFPFLPWYTGANPSALCSFYNACLNNGKDGKFFDMELYDSKILEQDIPLKVKGEIANLRCNSNYRLSEKARGDYQEFLKVHHKRLGL